MENITIIGAGIAGLTTALCLAQTTKNFNIQIFEAANFASEEGAGLQLSPNATHILRDIGLLDALIACAVKPENIIIANGSDNKQLADIPLGEFAQERYGAPYLVIHRADLHNILLKHANANADITINFGHELTEIEQQNSNYKFVFTHNGEKIRNQADIFIAADGVWSKTKTLLNLDVNNPTKFTGHIAWRCLIDSDRLDKKYQNSISVWFDKNAHAVLYPVRNGEKLNLVVLTEGEFMQKTWESDADFEKLNGYLVNWNNEFKNIINVSNDIKIWPLYAGFAEYQRGVDNILLIGDAAHPTLPYQAQGAAMAIEDAASLAIHLQATTQPIDVALRGFETMRHDRVQKTQHIAQKNVEIFHMKPPMSWARNLYLRLVTKFYRKSLLTRLDWLYSKRYR